MTQQFSPGVQQEFSSHLDAFKDNVRETIERAIADAAQRSAEGVAEGMKGSDIGPFRVEDFQVEVVVRGLRLTDASASGGGTAEAPKRKPAARRKPAKKPARRPASASSAKRGRPVGGVRLALLSAFDSVDGELSTEEIRAALSQQGVETTTDNLHQQLRRLVQAGELARVGRGRYGRAQPGTTG